VLIVIALIIVADLTDGDPDRGAAWVHD